MVLDGISLLLESWGAAQAEQAPRHRAHGQDSGSHRRGPFILSIATEITSLCISAFRRPCCCETESITRTGAVGRSPHAPKSLSTPIGLPEHSRGQPNIAASESIA
jgi:hypothetical protein